MKKVLASTVAVMMLAGCGASGLTAKTAASIRAAGAVAARHFKGSVLVNGTAGGTVQPGAPANLSFGFVNDGKPVTEFEPEHGKYMHLVAVSSDLDTFAHVHPDLRGGTFQLAANEPSGDPDNQDAARVFPKAGSYFLFAELTPQGEGPQEPRYQVVAPGAAQPVALVPDQPAPDGTIRKFFTADGRPGKAGDAYQVTLKVEKGEHHPGMPMVTLTYNLQESHDQSRHYGPVTTLEPWMGMAGHAIVIGAAGARLEDKVFRHLHASHGAHTATDGGDQDHGGAEPGLSGPEVSFMMMGADVPADGVYKVWAQLKNHGRVLTLPFVIQL